MTPRITSTQNLVKKYQKIIRLKNFTLGFVIYVFINLFINQSLLMIFGIIIPPEHGVDNVLVESSETIFKLSQMLFLIPLIKLSEKIGKRNVLMISFTCSLISIVFLYFYQSIFLFILSRIIAGMNVNATLTYILIDEYYEEEDKKKGTSIYLSARISGIMLGVIFGGFSFDIFKDSANTSFSLFIILSLFSIFIILYYVKDPPKKKIEINPNENEEVEDKWKIRKDLIKSNPKYLGFLIVTVLLNLTFSGYGTYWAWMIPNHYGVKAIYIGFYVAPLLIAGILATIFAGKYKKSTLLSKISCYFGMSLLIFVLIFPFAEESKFLFTIYGIFISIINCILIQITDAECLNLNNEFGQEIKREGIAFYKLMAMMGTMIGPLLFGLLRLHIWKFLPLLAFPLFIIAIFSIFRESKYF